MSNYFSIERNGQCHDKIVFQDYADNNVFMNVVDMSYNELKEYEDLDAFVAVVMEAADNTIGTEDDQTIVTCIDENDVFVWSIIMGSDGDDGIRYVLVDWRKDDKRYKYEN